LSPPVLPLAVSAYQLTTQSSVVVAGIAVSRVVLRQCDITGAACAVSSIDFICALAAWAATALPYMMLSLQCNFLSELLSMTMIPVHTVGHDCRNIGGLPWHGDLDSDFILFG